MLDSVPYMYGMYSCNKMYGICHGAKQYSAHVAEQSHQRIPACRSNCAIRTAHCAMYAVISQQAPRLGMVLVPRCPRREHAFGPSGDLPRSALVAQGPLRCRRASENTIAPTIELAIQIADTL